jgi:serine kinase of HPr protein (carbohydrate metabolism regulator)
MHGTCVALGGWCALLRGGCGAGKSDLALRFLFLPEGQLQARPALIADDQVILRRSGKKIVASCPPALAGKIEVRGAGIARLPVTAGEAELRLIAELDSSAEEPRFPDADRFDTVLGLPVRRILLNPFELSAPIKLALIMQNFFAADLD